MADQQKKFTRKEVTERASTKEVCFIIDNIVYDVTKFTDEHPGGHEVLVNLIGKDATENFEDVGHSIDAKELMVKYRIGDLVDQDRVESTSSKVWRDPSVTTAESEVSFFSSWKLPLALGLLATVLYSYLFA